MAFKKAVEKLASCIFLPVFSNFISCMILKLDFIAEKALLLIIISQCIQNWEIFSKETDVLIYYN